MLAMTALLVMAIPMAQGAIKDWTGTTNTNWGTDSNWSPSGVPTSSDEVYIDNVANDPIIQTDADAYYITINGSAILEVDGATLNVTQTIQVQSTGTLDISHDSNVLNLGNDLRNYGVITCGASNTPEVHLDDLVLNTGSSFTRGQSTIYFDMSASSIFYNSANEDLYNVVVDVNDYFRPTHSNGMTVNDMTIDNGYLDPNSNTVIVGGNFECFDRVLLFDPDDNLSVHGTSRYFNGSTLKGDDGTLYLEDDLDVDNGADVRLWGNSTVHVGGTNQLYFDIYDADCFFNDLVVNKSSNWAAIRTYMHVNDTISVQEGDLYVLFAPSQGYIADASYLTVEDGADLYMFNENALVNVTNTVTIETGGQAWMGTVSTWGGALNIQGDLLVYGEMTFRAGGCNVTLGDDMTIYASGNVTMYNGNITGTVTDSQLNLFGDLYIESSTTTVFFHQWNINGLGSQLWVATHYTPTLQVTGMVIQQGTPSTFHAGNSTFMAIGSSYPAFDARLTYFGIGVDLTSGHVGPNYAGTMYIESHLVIINGEFRLADHVVQVNSTGSYWHDGMEYTGLANIGGELRIDSDDEYLNIVGHGGMYWGASSLAHVDAGTINCSGNLSVEDGADVNLTGTNQFAQIDIGSQSFYWINSSDFSFNEYVLGSFIGTTSLRGTRTMVVDRNLTLWAWGAFLVAENDLVVWGDLKGIEGTLYSLNGRNATFHGSGTLESGGYIYLGSNSSSADGGTLTFDGHLTVQEHLIFERSGGELFVNDVLYVTDTGSVVLRGSGGDITANGINMNRTSPDWSQFEIWSSDTRIVTTYWYIRGNITVDDAARPTITVTQGSFNWWDGDIDMGHSELRFNGSGAQMCEDDIEYWGLVIDKPSTGFYFEAGSGPIIVHSYVAVERGVFDVDNDRIVISGNGTDGWNSTNYNYRGLVVHSGTLRMNDPAGVLRVRTHCMWLDWAKADVTTGTIRFDALWSTGTKTDVNLTGDNVVVYNSQSYLWSLSINSPDFTFHDFDIRSNRDYSVYQFAQEPVVIDGNLTIDNTDPWDDLNVSGPGMVVHRHVAIDTGSINIATGATFEVGRNLRTVSTDPYIYLWNGRIEVDGFMAITGSCELYVRASGGSIVVGGTAWMDGTMDIDVNDQGSLYMECHEMQINGTGSVSVRDDDVIIRTALDIQIDGELVVNPGREPEFHVGDDFGFGSGTFVEGQSSVWFEGGLSHQYAPDRPYWNLVVNRSTSFALDLWEDISVNAAVVVLSGSIELSGHQLNINGSDSFHHDGSDHSGFANLGGTLRMVSSADHLVVDGDVYWANGSSEVVTDGAIESTGDWTIEENADMTFSGTVQTNFTGSMAQDIENFSPDMNFVDFNVFMTSAHVYFKPSTEHYEISGNLTIDSPGDWGMSINAFATVSGDVDLVSGSLWVAINGNVTVLGTTSVADDQTLHVYGDLLPGDLLVDGTVALEGGHDPFIWARGSVFVPGSDIVFDADDSYMHVEGDLAINTTGTVNMTGTLDFLLEVEGDIIVDGVLNLTNDKAVVIARGNITIPYGTIDCGPDLEPEIHIHGDFDWLFGGITFVPGHSTVHFEGSGDQMAENDFRFWGIVVNKTGGELYFEWDDHTDTDIPEIESFLFIENGTLDVRNASIRVDGNGTGYSYGVLFYDGFTNLGGHLVMTHPNATLEAFEDILWGVTATGNVTNGEIIIHDDWIVQGGGHMAFGGDHLTYHKGSDTSVFNFAGTAEFNNFTMRKWSDNYYTWIVGEGGMNVTDTLIIRGDSYMEVRSVLEANMAHLWNNAELNLSRNTSKLHVWETIDTTASTTLFMENHSHASIRNLTGGADIWLNTNTDLAIHHNLWMTTSSTLHPGMSTVTFDMKTNSQVRVYNGGFYNVVMDKHPVGHNPVLWYYAVNYHIDGNLTLYNGSFNTNGQNFYLRGDFFNDGWGRFDPSPSGFVSFHGGGTQYIQTGGDIGYTGFEQIRVENGTEVRVQNHSMRVDNILIVDSGCSFTFEHEDGNLTLGSRGMFNDGRFQVLPTSGYANFIVEAGTTVTNNGTMDFIGESRFEPVRLKSSSNGTQWNLEDNSAPDGEPHVENARVKDSDASSGYTIYGYQYVNDSGNNDNWVFPVLWQLLIQENDGYSFNVTWTLRNTTSSVPINVPSQSFSDEGTQLTIEDEYTVSPRQRYYTEDTTSWTMDDNVTAWIYYYRQWKPDITLDGTDASHTVTAYYTSLDGNTTQSGQHTSWSRWADNGSSLSFSKDATGTPARHTSEDFDTSPWDPLTSALVRTVTYSGNEIPELYNGSMDPSGGNVTTVFNFTVEYWDANNDAPLFVYVNIDGSNFTMDQTDPTDTDYTDGAEFYYETKLSGGDHDYHFICNDTYTTNQTDSESTGVIVPEFGTLTVIITVMMVGVAVIWRRRRR